MVDVVFDEEPIAPISARKSEGFFVAFLVEHRFVKTAAGARMFLLLIGLVCFSFASVLFFRTVNEPPLNTQKVIPPGFQSQV